VNVKDGLENSKTVAVSSCGKLQPWMCVVHLPGGRAPEMALG
jgi:hypothetical protein